MIESQKFVMTNLRNGIDYLKNTCKDVGRNNHFILKLIYTFVIIYHFIKTLLTIESPIQSRIK